MAKSDPVCAVKFQNCNNDVMTFFFQIEMSRTCCGGGNERVPPSTPIGGYQRTFPDGADGSTNRD